MALFGKSDERLIEQLSHKNAGRRRNAIGQLGDRRIAAAALPIASLIAHESDSSNVRAAVVALWALGNSEAITVATGSLVEAFRSASSTIDASSELHRSNIIYAAGSLGSPVLFEFLVGAAGDPWPMVRNQARMGLARLGLPWALPVIVAGLDDVDNSCRTAAVDALQFLWHPSSLEHFLRLLPSPDADISHEAHAGVTALAAALGATGLLFLGMVDRDADTLARIIDTRLPEYAAERGTTWVCDRQNFEGHLLRDESIEQLAQGLTMPDEFERRWAKTVLGVLKDHAAEQNLADRSQVIEAKLGNG